MKPRLAVILTLLVVAPLAVLGWLGWRLAGHEREAVERRFDEALLGRLIDVRAGVDRLFEERERQLLGLTEIRSLDVDAVRRRVRESPLLRQLFRLDQAGRLVFPPLEAGIGDSERGPAAQGVVAQSAIPPRAELTASERDFIAGSQSLWDAIAQARTLSDERSQGMGAVPTQVGPPLKAAPAGGGGGVWHWGDDGRIQFWRSDAGGGTSGAELDRARLVADIIAALPASEPEKGGTSPERFALFDSDGNLVYQWGGGADPGKGEEPRVRLPLHPPINTWELALYVPDEDYIATGGAGLWINWIGGLTAVGLALAGLASYFYRESSREMREAAQRVTFVNRVSHELKTPLTNLRLYAELLEEGWDENDEEGRRRLDVIVSEGRRLTRMIDNVLTFSRAERKRVSLRLAPGVIDEVVRKAIDQFSLSFRTKGIAVEFTGGAERASRFDADALEQILGNLFSNVEKYAAEGGRIRITSGMGEEKAFVIVADEGPGIEPGQRERIFEPFVRLDNRLTEGVSGAGIGLTIARDLARMHGGDLVAAPSGKGARFELTLAVGAVEGMP